MVHHETIARQLVFELEDRYTHRSINKQREEIDFEYIYSYYHNVEENRQTFE